MASGGVCFDWEVCRVLWDVVVILSSSIVVLAPSGHFLDCTSIEFSERYAVSFGNVLPSFRRMLLPSSSGSSTGTSHALLNLKIKLLPSIRNARNFLITSQKTRGLQLSHSENLKSPIELRWAEVKLHIAMKNVTL